VKENRVISPGQLLNLIVLFEFGTALVLPIGLEAKQSTWLSVLLALPGGIALFLLYTYLLRQFPRTIWSGCIRNILGRFIGYPVSLMYVAYFLYGASRNLREAGDLLVTAAYDQTPLFVIHLVMAAAVVYVLYKGLEVFSRLGQVYFIIMLSLGLIGNAAVFVSGLVDINNLLPIQGEGWGSVFQAAYPHIWMFPFGEVLAFATIIPFLKKETSAEKTGIVALTFSGGLLCLSHAMQVAVLGADVYGRATFPLFQTISMVNIGDFMQRLDAIVMLTLIIGVFFKMSVYCYAAMSTMADLLRMPDERPLALPVGVVVLYASIISAWSYPAHAEEGKAGIFYVLLPVCVIIPGALLVVHLARKRLGLYR